MQAFTIGYDATHDNVRYLPAGQQAAGYCTGPPGIRWDAADEAAFPGWIQIDQAGQGEPVNTTADVFDHENGAVTLQQLPEACKRATDAFHAGTRPGQRTPLVYASADVLTPVCNTLDAAGLGNGSVGLYMANWNLSQPQAIADLLAASGPFPVRAIQFKSGLRYDFDVFDTAWLENTSGKPRPAVRTAIAAAIPAGVEIPVLIRLQSFDGGKTWM